MDTATASFNTTVTFNDRNASLTKMSQQKNDRNVSKKKIPGPLPLIWENHKAFVLHECRKEFLKGTNI